MSVDRFVCYDLKGIQSFVFAVPRLKYIVGGSALVDRFDRAVTREVARALEGARFVYSGGGKGAFLAATPAAERALIERLVAEANRIGASLQIGVDEDFAEAATAARDLYPFLPRSGDLDGEPCAESGLFPVRTGGDVHPTVARRVFSRGEPLRRHFEERLLRGFEPPAALTGETLEFFSDVDADSEEDDGRVGACALGNRNRWAVICMDGNDIGAQFREMVRRQPPGDVFERWLEVMSGALDRSSEQACRAGLGAVLEAWTKEARLNDVRDAEGTVILPLRPLVVGGDDITVLCHAAYAFDFIKAVCAEFERSTCALAEAARASGIDLWPATGGRLTISAGVLFAATTLPLASAIPYAESLLASAKHRGRRDGGRPAPACVDWENVTESFLTTISDRRRVLRFRDEDIGETVELTERPYTLEDFERLRKEAKRIERVPRGVRHEVLTGLRTGYWNRRVLAARLAKRGSALADALAAEPRPGGEPAPSAPWRRRASKDGHVRSTRILDALTLLEEEARLDWETT